MDARMMQGPKVSVLIPTYNRATPLKLAVESVLRQTYADWEIIIIDDGSTDNTAEVVRQLIREQVDGTERIRYLYQENRGKSAALNHGLRYVHGEWIAFLDSDDQWLPTKLEEQFFAIRNCRPHCEACFTDSQYINNSRLQTTAFRRGKITYNGPRGVITNRVEFIANPFGILMQTLLVHSRIMQRVGDFDVSLRVVQDIDMVFRIYLETPLCYVNKPLVLVDRTPKRSEGLVELLIEKDESELLAQQNMYERWLCLSERLGKRAQDKVRARLSGIYCERANWHLQGRRFREALAAISGAASLKWTPAIAMKWCLTALVPHVARSIVLSRSRHGFEREAFLAAGREDMSTESSSDSKV